MKGRRDGEEKKIVGVEKIRSGLLRRRWLFQREEEESSKTLDLFLENGTSGVFREIRSWISSTPLIKLHIRTPVPRNE